MSLNNRDPDKSSLGEDNTPFFILGCVRSGTTMLRDVLRLHPRLECPEETHFYRWSDPCGSPRYDRAYITMKLFKEHRRLDGINENNFHDMRYAAANRKELMEGYGRLYLQAINNQSGRWFDKTPQNIYGIFLLGQDFPKAKFIHIYRNPLNVVASLCEGKVMAKHSIKGALNYWLESMTLVNEYKKLYPERVLEVPYEGITTDATIELKRICNFLNEDISKIDEQALGLHEEKNRYLKVLNKTDINSVRELSQPFLKQYGYDSGEI